MKKKFAALLALWMMLGAAGAMAADCGYNPFGGTVQTGSYYLTAEVVGFTIPSGQSVTLCLHGKTVNGMITIENGAHLTLMDCKGGGSVKAYSTGVTNKGTCTLVSGTISGVYDGVNNSAENSSFIMNGGTVVSNHTGSNNQYACVKNSGKNSSFIMSGGTLEASSNPSASACGVDNRGEGSSFTMSENAQISTARGYGVQLNGQNSSFTMESGTIVSEKSRGVSDTSDAQRTGMITMNGGTVTAGGVGVSSRGTFTMSSGTVTSTGTYANDCGVSSSGAFTMKGGTINAANSLGVMVDGDEAAFTMTGGTINAENDTGVEIDGGTFTMESGTVTAEQGVNIYNGGTFEMSGGTVTAQTDVGVIIGTKGGTFEMSGGTVIAADDIGVNVEEKESVFRMSGDASVKATGGSGVYVSCGLFEMNGGTVTGENGEYEYYSNGVHIENGKFVMNGGTVIGTHEEGQDACGVENYAGTFTMNGGTVTGSSYGVENNSDMDARFSISVGTISGGKTAVVDYDSHPYDEAEAEKMFILPGSYKAEGEFGGKMVRVAKMLAGAAGDLPKTGDPSMLGAWIALLGASYAGLKLRRKM